MSYKRNIIPYNPDLKTLAKELRRNMTMSEILLWKELKNKQICGFDFDRQRPLDKYIVDFFCKELSLAIEIDGDSHTYKFDYDEERQTRLEKLGVHFLRFEDKVVKKNMWNVLRVIENWINMNKPEKKKPTLTPPRRGTRKKIPPLAPPRRGIKKSIMTTPNNKLIYKSTPIWIGSIPLGGDYPIRLQSMTNTDTMNTRASVDQCIRIIEAGGDFVRLTAQGIREAENLANIKKELRNAGFETPLIADIHFNPLAAETAAGIVEKVRINPGNYTDKRASFTKDGIH